MPRKLVQDGYRGWYGFESRYDTAIRNSLSKIWNQNARAGLVKGEHVKRLRELEVQEKAFEIQQKKEKRDTQMELVEMRAYRRVYRQYSFTEHNRAETKRLEKERQEREEQEDQRKKVEQQQQATAAAAERENESESMQHAKRSTARADHKGKKVKDTSRVYKVQTARKSSLRDVKGQKEPVDDVRNTTKNSVKLQKSLSEGNVWKRSLEEKVQSFDRRISDLGQIIEEKLGERSGTIKTTKSTEITHNIELVESPKPEKAATAKPKYIPSSSYGIVSKSFMTEPIPEEDEDYLSDVDNIEVFSDFGSKSTESLSESVTSSSVKQNSLDSQVPLDVNDFKGYDLNNKRSSIAMVNAWKLGLFRSYTFNQRKDSVAASSFSRKTGTSIGDRAADSKPKLWEMPLTRNDRKSRVFPQNCRNGFMLRRMIDEKAGRLIQDWNPENVRKMKAKKIRETMSLPDLVQRQKPTSAIFREFKECKEAHRSLDQYHQVIKRQGLMPRIDVLKINK